MAAERYAKLPAGVRRCAGALSQFVPEPRDGTLGVDRLKRFLRTGNGAVPDRFLSLMTRLSNDERLHTLRAWPRQRARITVLPLRRRFRDVSALKGAPPASRRLFLDYTTFLPDDNPRAQ